MFCSLVIRSMVLPAAKIKSHLDQFPFWGSKRLLFLVPAGRVVQPRPEVSHDEIQNRICLMVMRECHVFCRALLVPTPILVHWLDVLRCLRGPIESVANDACN